ncbi:peptide/nickel transport system permease protein [Nocardioides alpinus]|jgi:peptide/nickel transport system permease protein|uniref:ABC transporter permease n=2 Tax=Nocardioides TaxID=1839 RepID=A0A4V1RNE9_9ACTN|nr:MULTISPECIES: ABC transporter permease [Nocardioides]PKH40202.1 ABC transporter permease [Nocardioides alpinus]RYC05617.1 ABC transporter permease [Nocardioides zhouii]SFB44578.1 peptide/nickel transport system permease protein [Nocardioides alpinus]
MAFLAKRAAILVATILVASFVIFAAMYMAPGKPIGALTGGRSVSPQALEALEQRYRLNEPFLSQYGHWLSNAIRGDLGVSIATKQDVSELIVERAGITLSLVLYAAVLIVVIGIGLGLLAGLRPGWVDTSVVVASSAAAAVPAFLSAIVLTLIFAVTLSWLPALGAGEGVVDRFVHLTLPAISLALSSIAVVARVTRTSIREESRKEHVQTAVSRGLPRRAVIIRHVLRNAAIPITTVTGITIASLIAVSAVVESAFSLNGLGQYLIVSSSSKDLAVVQGISLVLVLAFVLLNVVVDLAYAVLDPRVRLGAKAT